MKEKEKYITKKKLIKEIQKRLPEDITIVDETTFDITEDEFVGILSWIKFFNQHYAQFGKNQYPQMMFPIISKRLWLDFGLYRMESDGIKNNILLCAAKKETLKELIDRWKL